MSNDLHTRAARGTTFQTAQNEFTGGFAPKQTATSIDEVVIDYQTEQLSFLDTAIEQGKKLLESMSDAESWQYRSQVQNLKDLDAWRNDLRTHGLNITRVELFAPAATQKILEQRLGSSAKFSPIAPHTHGQAVPSQGTSADAGIMSDSEPLDSWVPTEGNSLVDADATSRYTYQYFGWAQGPTSDPNYYLRYFKDGGNHTFEQETHYDGWDEGGSCYYVVPGYPSDSYYWAPCPQVYANDVWQGSWNSNLPRAYYDTTFSNNPNEPNLVIGTADAALLAPAQWYWYWIRTQVTNPKENQPYIEAPDDRISIMSQKGYRSPSGCYNTWCINGEQTHPNKTFAAALVAPSGGWQQYWPYGSSQTSLP